MASIFFLLIISYLLGSVSFGKIVGSRKGVDLQKRGSGNTGFANSLRVMGWKPALVVLAGDIIKGYLPTYYALTHYNLPLSLLVGLIAIVGHIFSPWLKFRGGKGVATIIGVTLALNYQLALLTMTIWSIVFLVGKTASIASLVAMALLPPLALLIDSRLTGFYLLLLAVVSFTHRSNITKLMEGSETKIN